MSCEYSAEFGAAAANAFSSVLRTLTGSSPSKSRSIDGRLSSACNGKAVPPFSAQEFRASSIQRLERRGQAPQERIVSHLGPCERYRWAPHGHHSLCQSFHAASSVGVSTPRSRHVHQRTRTHWSGYGRIRSKLYRSTGGSPTGRSSAVIPSSRAQAISMTARSCVAAQTFSGQSPAGCPSCARPGRASRRPLWPSRSSRRPKRLSSVM